MSNYAGEEFTSCNPCVFRLIRNCRNTAQIARRNSMLTNTPATKYLNLLGPK